MDKGRNILKDVEYDLEELNKFKEKEIESKFKPYQKEGSKKGYNNKHKGNKNGKRYEGIVNIYSRLKEGKVREGVYLKGKDLEVIKGLVEYNYVLILKFKGEELTIELLHKLKEDQFGNTKGDVLKYLTEYKIEFDDRGLYEEYNHLNSYNNMFLNTGEDVFLKEITYYLGFDSLNKVEEFIIEEFSYQLKELVNLHTTHLENKYNIARREDIKDKLISIIMLSFAEKDLISGEYKSDLDKNIQNKEGNINKVSQYFIEEEFKGFLKEITNNNYGLIDRVYRIYNKGKLYKTLVDIEEEYKNNKGFVKNSKVYYDRYKRGTQKQLLNTITKGYNSKEDSEWLDNMSDKDVEMRIQDLW